MWWQVHENGPVLDDEILADPEVQAAINEEGSVHRSYKILNVDRAALGRVGGAVARLHGDSGFAGTISLDLQVGAAVSWQGQISKYSTICVRTLSECMGETSLTAT